MAAQVEELATKAANYQPLVSHITPATKPPTKAGMMWTLVLGMKILMKVMAPQSSTYGKSADAILISTPMGSKATRRCTMSVPISAAVMPSAEKISTGPIKITLM